MPPEPITPARIDELLAFLPVFVAPDFQPFKDCGGSQRRAEGSVSAAYPIYADEVVDFTRLAGQEWWRDYDYEPRAAGAMLEDETRLRSASLDDVKSMLTYYVRGERFCDGHWAHLITSGRVAALLRHLAALKPGPTGSR